VDSCELATSDSGQGLAAVCCEHGNELPDRGLLGCDAV